MLYERLQEHRVLETLQEMLGPIVLPVDLTIRTKGCDGLSVSWYDTPNCVAADGPPTVRLFRRCWERAGDNL
jgi:hypothetical protein